MEVTCTSSENRRVVMLPDELVTEILARVPYRSLCQFKCVSRSWRVLCSEPAVFRRCPQSLVGFFLRTTPLSRHFVNASGRGPPMVNPSLPFLPPGYSAAVFLDSCNGLLLCKRDEIHSQPQVPHSYFVCNPATKKWMGLPDPEVPAKTHCVRVFRLGFDPAVPSAHFRVFVLDVDPRPPMAWDQPTIGVEIFSSETGAWSFRRSEWGSRTVVGRDSSVFLNGTLHLTSPRSLSLLTVDMAGRAWGRIRTPHDFSFIGVSQGRLHAAQIRNHRRDDECIGVWVLEDSAAAGRQRWALKHAVEMFGARPTSFGDSYSFVVHAVDPEHAVIFISAGKMRSLMSYDMEKREVRFICNLGEGNLSAHPYMPCFSDWLLEGH